MISIQITKSQLYYKLVLGLLLLIGFKNSIDRGIGVLIDAISTINIKHYFISIIKQSLAIITKTAGNLDYFIILYRGTNSINFNKE